MRRRALLAVLAGLLRGDDIDALVEAVAPSRVRGWFMPDIADLELVATALDLASIAGVSPLGCEGLGAQSPETQFRGRADHRASHPAAG